MYTIGQGLNAIFLQGFTRDNVHDDVRNEKGAAAVAINEVRKSPQIAKAHGVRQTGH